MGYFCNNPRTESIYPYIYVDENDIFDCNVLWMLVKGEWTSSFCEVCSPASRSISWA